DCTGHGVPGAFMSMIGIAILNDIVIKEGETQPRNILEGLNRLVRRVLKQDEEGSNQDGMDVALVAWDANHRVKVLFAGAKRPLYYMKNGKIEEIRGVQKSIGGQQLKAREFVQEEIEVPSDTVLYLFTDGYTDQSIGTGNARIGTAKFKELLETHSSRSLAEQKSLLESFLVEQQGENPQRDDITVVGIRV
ncbi:MAG: SpoIIE family protein phosphatase, partial [Flammeovirgaceae bacterium]|nr:SpoIIE family protein phosphatase [Flammeovirgaceae bacterium]MDW8287562.1 SpoIIE family protein phosphatase [Flammeovirgaceae bacterium]